MHGYQLSQVWHEPSLVQVFEHFRIEGVEPQNQSMEGQLRIGSGQPYTFAFSLTDFSFSSVCRSDATSLRDE